MSQDSEGQKRPDRSLIEDYTLNPSPDKLNASLSDIDTKLSHLDERIAKIIEARTINGMPMIGMVLNFVQDPDELKPFAEGLERVAMLVKVKKELQSKKTALSLLKEQPAWFIAELNDFSTDVDNVILALESPKD